MRRPELREVPGLFSVADLTKTVNSIVRTQQPCGSLPWPDGHTDPWDHVECAMALTLGGHLDAARAAYEWLAATQAADGSWAASYDQMSILDVSVDSNQCAYVAVGVWHWWLETTDSSLLKDMWPVVRNALDLVVSMQLPSGAIAWSRSPEGVVSGDALLTGSSSTYQALRCGLAIADLLGEPQPEWEIAAGRLQHAVARSPDAFLDKNRFSMDWYYPILGGAVRGAEATRLLDRYWDKFVVDGYGCRCVSDRPWVTGAESSELALALIATGQEDRAMQLLHDIQRLRRADGSYWTGFVVDDGLFWPVEASGWTAAAVVMAADALAGGTMLDVFTGKDLPLGLPVDEQGGKRGLAALADLRTFDSPQDS